MGNWKTIIIKTLVMVNCGKCHCIWFYGITVSVTQYLWIRFYRWYCGSILCCWTNSGRIRFTCPSNPAWDTDLSLCPMFIAGLIWFFLPLSICFVALWIGLNIICFSLDTYLYFFIFLQLLPSVFLMARFVCVSIKRYSRVRRIKKYSRELECLLNK